MEFLRDLFLVLYTFLIFINDLPNASRLLNFLLFADDTSILASHKSYDELFLILILSWIMLVTGSEPINYL